MEEKRSGDGALRRPVEDAREERAGPAGDAEPARPRLVAEGLIKAYTGRTVVSDVSLDVAAGEIVGLLGPNGAGKTTTFSIVVGLVEPDAGTVRLGDRDLTDLPMYRRARAGISYLPQEPSVFRKMTVEQNLLAIFETLDLPHSAQQERADELLAEFGLEDRPGPPRLHAVGGRAPAGRDRAEPRRLSLLPPARRALRRDRPDRGPRHPVDRAPPGDVGHRNPGHGPQRPRDLVDRGSGLYNQRRRDFTGGTPLALSNDAVVKKIYLGEAFPTPLGAQRRWL